jgi:hypothetical protein
MKVEVLDWTEARHRVLSKTCHAVILRPENAHDEMQLRLLGLGASDYGGKEICLKRVYDIEDEDEDEDERRFYLVKE